MEFINQNISNTIENDSKLSNSDLQNYSSNWVWRAIESLVTAKNFNPAISAIANRLNVSIEAVVNALEGLERLNIIKRDGQSFLKPTNVTFLDKSNTNPKNLLVAHGHLAPQIIGMLNEESIFATRFTLGSLKIARKHAHKLQDFLNSVDQDGSIEDNPDILAIDISIAQVNSSKGGI